MRSSLALAAASLAAGVYAAHENATMPMYTTEVVTEYTTYCPEPTSIVHKNETYTVTAVRKSSLRIFHLKSKVKTLASQRD